MKKELVAAVTVLLALPTLGLAQKSSDRDPHSGSSDPIASMDSSVTKEGAASRSFQGDPHTDLTSMVRVVNEKSREAASNSFAQESAKRSEASLKALKKAYPENAQEIEDVKDGLDVLVSNLSNKSSTKALAYQSVFSGLERLALPMQALCAKNEELGRQVTQVINHKYYFAYENKAFSLQELVAKVEDFFPDIQLQGAEFYASLSSGEKKAYVAPQVVTNPVTAAQARQESEKAVSAFNDMLNKEPNNFLQNVVSQHSSIVESIKREKYQKLSFEYQNLIEMLEELPKAMILLEQENADLAIQAKQILNHHYYLSGHQEVVTLRDMAHRVNNEWRHFELRGLAWYDKSL